MGAKQKKSHVVLSDNEHSELLIKLEIESSILSERQKAFLQDESLSKARNDRYLKKGMPFVKNGSRVGYLVSDYQKYVEKIRVQTVD